MSTLTAAAAVVLFLMMTGWAAAHGGKLQVALARGGPYAVSVWTQPDPARVGSLDVSLAILREDTRESVQDASVRVMAHHRGTQEAADGIARQAAGGFFEFLAPALYHTVLVLPTEGRWHVAVFVVGALGDGNVEFDLDVAPPVSIPWGLLTTGAAVALVVALGWRHLRNRSVRQRLSGSSRNCDRERGEATNVESGGVAETGEPRG